MQRLPRSLIVKHEVKEAETSSWFFARTGHLLLEDDSHLLVEGVMALKRAVGVVSRKLKPSRHGCDEQAGYLWA